MQPNSAIKLFWTFIILILLIVTGLTTPFRVAFVDNDSVAWVVLDYIFDALFLIDIFMNFLSAYVDEKHNQTITNWGIIAKKYILSWFIIDLIAM